MGKIDGKFERCCRLPDGKSSIGGRVIPYGESVKEVVGNPTI